MTFSDVGSTPTASTSFKLFKYNSLTRRSPITVPKTYDGSGSHLQIGARSCPSLPIPATIFPAPKPRSITAAVSVPSGFEVYSILTSLRCAKALGLGVGNGPNRNAGASSAYTN